MSRPDRVGHLVGYAVLALVLGTATWATIIGQVVAVVFALGTAVYAAGVGQDAVASRLRREARVAADPPAATDGGDPQRGEA